MYVRPGDAGMAAYAEAIGSTNTTVRSPGHSGPLGGTLGVWPQDPKINLPLNFGFGKMRGYFYSMIRVVDRPHGGSWVGVSGKSPQMWVRPLSYLQVPRKRVSRGERPYCYP